MCGNYSASEWHANTTTKKNAKETKTENILYYFFEQWQKNPELISYDRFCRGLKCRWEEITEEISRREKKNEQSNNDRALNVMSSIEVNWCCHAYVSVQHKEAGSFEARKNKRSHKTTI